MKIQCQQCASKFKVPPKFYGKRIKCPKCKGAITVPVEPTSSAATNDSPSPPANSETPAAVLKEPAKDLPTKKIKVSCTNCNATLNAPPKLIGKRVACPKCKQPILLAHPGNAKTPNLPKAEAPIPQPTPQLTPQLTPQNPTAEPATEPQTQLPVSTGALRADSPSLEKPVSSETDVQSVASTTSLTDTPSLSPLQPTLRTASDFDTDQTPDDLNDERVAPVQDDREEGRDENRPKSSRRRRRRRRSKSSKSKLKSIVSGLIGGIGSLFLLAAIYLYFFGAPDQTAADPKPSTKPESAFTNSELNPTHIGEATDANKAKPKFIQPPPEDVEILARALLVPTFKMSSGETAPKSPEFNDVGFTFTAKSEYAQNTELKGLPEAINYRGKIYLNSKPSTSIPVNDAEDRITFFPPESYASALRLPQGMFLVPIGAIEFVDLVSTFDGKDRYDVASTRLLRRGGFKIMSTVRNLNFPKIIATKSGELNGDTKDVSLIWIDRNSEIRILENLDATGYNSTSTDVTFDVPSDSTGGIIVNQAGKIAGMVAEVQNGTGTVTQISKLLLDMRSDGDAIFSFSRSPISEDQAGKLSEASACLTQVVSKRKHSNTHAAFNSSVETQRGNDQTSRQTFNDQYDVNFTDSGQVDHFSIQQKDACRLPGFLGYPGMTAIIEFSEKPGETEWSIERKLSLGRTGNDRILVKNLRNTNELSHVIQTDDYRILNETDTQLTIERKYVVKSANTQPDKESPEWDIPAGFPFQVEGKFTYQYDKSLKLATSVEFEGVEQKHLAADLVAPVNLSFQMTRMPAEEIDETKLPWKSK